MERQAAKSRCNKCHCCGPLWYPCRPGNECGRAASSPPSQPTAHHHPPVHLGHLAGRRGQGDRRAREGNPALGLYLWLVVVTGVRRGELCGLQIRDVDLDRFP